MTEVPAGESADARQLRESRVVALRNGGQDGLADRFVGSGRLLEDIGEPFHLFQTDVPLLREARATLDTLLEDATLRAHGPAEAGADSDEEFYEKVHAAIDTLWADFDVRLASTGLPQGESEDAHRLRESRIAALRGTGQDGLGDRFVGSHARLLKDIATPFLFQSDIPRLGEARAGLDALLEDATLRVDSPYRTDEDIDDERFYEEILAGIDAWLVDWGFASFGRSLARESEQEGIAAGKVIASRTHRSPAFDVVWMGVTLLLMIVIIQVLVAAVNPLAAAVGTLCAGTLISIKIHQAAGRRRVRAIRQEVVEEAEALERNAARYAVEARVLELEGAGTSVESRRLKRRASRLDARASVLRLAATSMRA